MKIIYLLIIPKDTCLIKNIDEKIRNITKPKVG